jgi:GPH family glycoside/pentoside/hexuronide:cation symporter
MPERMSAGRRLAFTAGAPGFLAIDRVVSGILLYFYLPPPDRGLEPQVPEETFFGAFTAFGLAMIIARTVESLAAPVIGHASDRSRSRWGRRRSFMLCGFLPMVGLPLLAYWPPQAAGSPANVVWLTVLLSVFYVFSSMYTGPHAALVPEIARSDDERAKLSRLMALAAFPMAALLMAWPRGLDWGREAGIGATESIRWIVVVLAAMSFVLCAIPFFAIDEHRFTPSAPSQLSMREALASTLRNRPFLVFLAAHILFALAASLIFPVLPYIATVLLGRSEGFAFELGASLGGMLAVGYAVAPRLAARLGPKNLMVGCFALFAVASASLGLIRPDVPGGPHDSWNLAVAFVAMGAMGLPLSGVSVLPNVLLGQLIDDDERRTGTNRSAVFLGVVRAFDKWAFGLAAAVIAFLFARFGKAPAEPLGVLLVGPIGGVAGLLSALLFTRFPNVRVSGGVTGGERVADRERAPESK